MWNKLQTDYYAFMDDASVYMDLTLYTVYRLQEFNPIYIQYIV